MIFHRLVLRHTAARLKEYALEQGLDAKTAKQLADAVDDESVGKAARKAKAQQFVNATQVEGFGDGTILKMIRDWLVSDQGQAFIKILFDLLKAAL